MIDCRCSILLSSADIGLIGLAVMGQVSHWRAHRLQTVVGTDVLMVGTEPDLEHERQGLHRLRVQPYHQQG